MWHSYFEKIANLRQDYTNDSKSILKPKMLIPNKNILVLRTTQKKSIFLGVNLKNQANLCDQNVEKKNPAKCYSKIEVLLYKLTCFGFLYITEGEYRELSDDDNKDHVDK